MDTTQTLTVTALETSTEVTTKRERDSGRYAPSLDRTCRCGHLLGTHTSARVKGSQPCLSSDLGGPACDCDCFKAASK